MAAGGGVLAPVGLVKVDGQKMAVGVPPERVDADCVLAGTVTVDDLVLDGVG